MKAKWIITITSITLLTALAAPIRMNGQNAADTQSPRPRYKLVDLGTFGGPTSGQVSPGRNINNQGTTIPLGAELPVPDPFAPNCLSFPDCFLAHAAKWQGGPLMDLHALPGVNDSQSLWINDTGLIAGISENSLVDPLTGFPEVQAVLWGPNFGPLSLGGLGGNGSQTNAVNNRGQVVGMALNATPDDFAQVMYFLPAATQCRAFLWQPGAPMQDLLTLGGPDANALVINDRRQVAGFSFTDSTANSTTGIPTIHPFLWTNETGMVDLHSLGGTIAVPGSITGIPGGVVLNDAGQVVGSSLLEGDQTWHPFLWEGGLMKDLGTLGGNNGEAFFISQSGDVVGRSDISPSSTVHHAFLWTNGMMTDLGSLPPCLYSTAVSVNSSDQVVGDTGNCPGGGEGDPFFSQHGELMVDLNTMVLPGSGLTIIAAAYINDRGEIAGTGILPNGDQHAVLLIPATAAEITAANALGASQSISTTVRTLVKNSENSASSGRNRALNKFRRTRQLP